MNDAEAMKLRIAGLFLYHGVHNLIPPGEAITMFHGVGYYPMLCRPVVDAGCFGLGIIIRKKIWVDTMGLK